jgi:hypothetical protein
MNDVEAKSSPSTEAYAAKFEGPHPRIFAVPLQLETRTKKMF